MRDLENSGGDAAAWALLFGLLLSIAALMIRAPLAIEATGFRNLVLACGGLICAAQFYRRVRPREHFAAMCVSLSQVILFSAAGSILSYLLAREGGALWDVRLARWDHAIGFDWLAYVRWVDVHPWLVRPLRFAYASLIPQVIAVVLALGFTRRLIELRTVMLAAIGCGMVAILISAFIPAVGNYTLFGLGSDDFQAVRPLAGHSHEAAFNGLRDGTFAVLRLREMEGIITFPSYHAGLAAITLWGFWVSRISWVRWPGVLVAGATIVSTPIDGGHYAVDVIAGILIAVASLWAARRAIFWRPAWNVTALPFRRLREASVR